MSAKVVKLDNPLVCGICGSEDILQKQWQNPNTKTPAEDLESDTEEWCNACAKITLLVRREEYDERHAQEEESQSA